MTERNQEKKTAFVDSARGENTHPNQQQALHFNHPSETKEESTLSLLEEASSQAPGIAPDLLEI
jgi:hypothetical protein